MFGLGKKKVSPEEEKQLSIEATLSKFQNAFSPQLKGVSIRNVFRNEDRVTSLNKLEHEIATTITKQENWPSIHCDIEKHLKLLSIEVNKENFELFLQTFGLSKNTYQSFFETIYPKSTENLS